MEKSYVTYILECVDGSYYCGFSSNLEQRLRQHQEGKGAKYTRSRRPVRLLTFVTFDDKHDAYSCEWWFKNKLKRPQKEKLIQAGNIHQAYLEWVEKRKKSSKH
ncbi:MAG: GIY-YIG nuclease family protein [Lactovum sp.]